MKLFIASHSQLDAKALMSQLQAQGHQVVARWVTSDTKFGHGIGAYTDEEKSALAAMDEADVRAADALVVIAEAEGRTVPGGKHVETGIAIALHKPIYVLGSRENIFHWHPLVHTVPTIDDLLRAMRAHVLSIEKCPDGQVKLAR